jgi:poly-beta-1,6-N-acetyl-D-glucosamine synthase
MNDFTPYVVISPVRNEQSHLLLTVQSMANQTAKPTCWVIVDDGSTDATGHITEEAARSHAWIKVVHLEDRGFRKPGGGVVDAFYEGFPLVANYPWEYIVKLDGDLSFEPAYFEKCFMHFRSNPRLGIAGGTICSAHGPLIEPESRVDPKFHVRGATKIYRKACWQEIGGLIHAPGWDTLDEVKANMLGWSTSTLPDINVIHHRPAGAAYGLWKDRVKGGVGYYTIGYHPVFMLLKCLRRMAEKPYIIGGCGLWFGFLKGHVRRFPRVRDRALIKYFRQQQLNRMLGRKSLWS